MRSRRHIARDISYSHSASSKSGRAVIRLMENTTGRLRLIKRADGYEQEVAAGRDFWAVMVERYGLTLDVVGGALITDSDELQQKLHHFQNTVGATPGPMDCFLLLRGTKTLHVRLERHCENAARIAEHLAGHKHVAKVHYPGLESHPQYELAQRQMLVSALPMDFQRVGATAWMV